MTPIDFETFVTLALLVERYMPHLERLARYIWERRKPLA
jgi:hypothetical protein